MKVFEFSQPADSLSVDDVLRTIPAFGLADQASRNMISATRTIAKALGAAPTEIPLEADSLRRRIALIKASEIGCSENHWRNVKALFNRALKDMGLLISPYMKGQLSSPWEALARLAGAASCQSEFRRVARIFEAAEISPAMICQDQMEVARAQLTIQGAKRVKARITNFVLFWNRIVTANPGFGLGPIKVHDDGHTFTRPWGDFPNTLALQKDEFLRPTTRVQLFDPDKAKRRRADTIYQYDRKIRRLAAAAVRAGTPIDGLTGLDQLVELNTLEGALSFIADRNGGQANNELFNMAGLALSIAKWCNRPAEDLAVLSGWLSNWRPKRGGMTKKNRDRLRQLISGDTLNDLIRLPYLKLAALNEQRLTKTAARAATRALMLAIVIQAPLRLKNLASLDRAAHFVPAFGSDQYDWLLEIEEEESKNEVLLTYPVTPPVMSMIENHMRRYQPILSKVPTTKLFPGRIAGVSLSRGGFARGLCNFINAELGLTMNVHLFRHLTAWMYLQHEPGDYERVRQFLGHKNVNTTKAFYTDLEMAEAVKLYQQLVAARLATPKVGRA